MGNSSCCGSNLTTVSHPLSSNKSNYAPTESQLRKAVENLFRKYDTDNSGFLERAEVEKIIRVALE